MEERAATNGSQRCGDPLIVSGTRRGYFFLKPFPNVRKNIRKQKPIASRMPIMKQLNNLSRSSHIPRQRSACRQWTQPCGRIPKCSKSEAEVMEKHGPALMRFLTDDNASFSERLSVEWD